MAKDFSDLFNTEGQLSSLFTKLNGEKGSLLTRAEQYAGWTLPSLFPDENVQGQHAEFQHDYQSIGARATNHLANKLTLALFAPSRPFFRLEADFAFEQQLAEDGIDTAKLEEAFAVSERAAMKKMMQRGVRVSMPYAMKLLIISGNALKYFPISGSKAQVFNLRDYCVKRDLSGFPIDMITQERKSLGALPDDMQYALKLKEPSAEVDTAVTLYTRIRYHEHRYHVYQSLNEVPYGDRKGSYLPQQCPWIPMTWTLTRGSDYGNGLVEEYAGDFHALSSLSEAMIIGAAIASDIKFLVDPTGNTDIAGLNAAPSGAYVAGRADDISTVSTDKANDWAMVLQIIQTYEKRIGMAFLLGSAVTRDAERVTAEEIRFQAMELETSLGGVYSRLAEDLQIPMAYIFLSDADFDLGASKDVTPVVITGLDALSRNSEAESLMLFISDLAQLANLPEQVTGRLELNPVIATIGAARGVEFKKYLKDEAKYQEEQKQLQAQQVAAAQQVETNKANANAQAK